MFTNFFKNIIATFKLDIFYVVCVEKIDESRDSCYTVIIWVEDDSQWNFFFYTQRYVFRAQTDRPPNILSGLNKQLAFLVEFVSIYCSLINTSKKSNNAYNTVV